MSYSSQCSSLFLKQQSSVLKFKPAMLKTIPFKFKVVPAEHFLQHNLNVFASNFFPNDGFSLYPNFSFWLICYQWQSLCRIAELQLIRPFKDMTSQQENIFNAKKRTADDVVKFPYKLRGSDEEQIEKLLKQQSDKHNENFEKYMLKHYANFNHKINKCKLRCAQKGKDYSEIKVCYSRCETGVNTFRRFVDQRIQQMQSLLNQCISAAGQLPNSVMETYRCYDLYNKGFSHLRSIIKEESLYYQ